MALTFFLSVNPPPAPCKYLLIHRFCSIDLVFLLNLVLSKLGHLTTVLVLLITSLWFGHVPLLFPSPKW